MELFGKFSNSGVWLFIEQEEEKTWRDVFVAQNDIKMAAMCVYCSQLATQTVLETEISISNAVLTKEKKNIIRRQLRIHLNPPCFVLDELIA